MEAGVELSPNSRFSIHENPNVAPGVCAVCRSSGGDDRKFIDFGFQLDFYGAVYFCSYCFAEAAKCFSFIPWESYASLQGTHYATLETLRIVQERFEEFQNATRTLLRDCRCPDSAGSPDGNALPDAGNPKAVRKAKPVDRESDKASGS